MKQSPHIHIKHPAVILVVFMIVFGATIKDVHAQSMKERYAEKVKREFLFAWNNYKKYAWGHDELMPLTKSYYDWYGKGNSLLMTPVDAYDTMVLMGLKKEAEEDQKLIDE